MSLFNGKQIKNNTISISKIDWNNYTVGDSITGVDPSKAPINKSFAEALIAGQDYKDSADVGTISDLSATYAPTGGTASTGSFTGVPLVIDDFTLQVGSRVLVKNQTDDKQNGIYVVTAIGASASLERAEDHNGNPVNNVSGGNSIYVESGTVNEGRGYLLQGSGNLTLNTDSLVWVQYTAKDYYTFGSGITRTNKTITLGGETANTTFFNPTGTQLEVEFSSLINTNEKTYFGINLNDSVSSQGLFGTVVNTAGDRQFNLSLLSSGFKVEDPTSLQRFEVSNSSGIVLNSTTASGIKFNAVNGGIDFNLGSSSGQTSGGLNINDGSNTFTQPGGGVNITSSEGVASGNISSVNVNGTSLSLSSNNVAFSFSSAISSITDSRTVKTGIQLLGFGETDNTGLGADYSTLVANSLTPKKYVDDSINTQIQANENTFSNGLSKNSQKIVKLGGTNINENTYLSLGKSIFQFDSNADGFEYRFVNRSANLEYTTDLLTSLNTQLNDLGITTSNTSDIRETSSQIFILNKEFIALIDKSTGNAEIVKIIDPIATVPATWTYITNDSTTSPSFNSDFARITGSIASLYSETDGILIVDFQDKIITKRSLAYAYTGSGGNSLSSLLPNQLITSPSINTKLTFDKARLHITSTKLSTGGYRVAIMAPEDTSSPLSVVIINTGNDTIKVYRAGDAIVNGNTAVFPTIPSNVNDDSQDQYFGVRFAEKIDYNAGTASYSDLEYIGLWDSNNNIYEFNVATETLNLHAYKSPDYNTIGNFLLIDDISFNETGVLSIFGNGNQFATWFVDRTNFGLTFDQPTTTITSEYFGDSFSFFNNLYNWNIDIESTDYRIKQIEKDSNYIYDFNFNPLSSNSYEPVSTKLVGNLNTNPVLIRSFYSGLIESNIYPITTPFYIQPKSFFGQYINKFNIQSNFGVDGWSYTTSNEENPKSNNLFTRNWYENNKIKNTFINGITKNDSEFVNLGGFVSDNINFNSKSLDLNLNMVLDFTVDSSFNVNSFLGGVVRKTILQPDGKIIAVGGFTSYNNITSNRVVRINSDGSIDQTFNTNIGTGITDTSGTTPDVYDIDLQSDGKIVIGGTFTTFNGVTVNNIVRLNSDGTRDATFNTGTGFTWNFTIRVSALKIDDTGRIIVGLNTKSSTFDGTVLNSSLVRINIDGSLDNIFDSDSEISTITIDNESIYIGLYNSYTILKKYTNDEEDPIFNKLSDDSGIGFISEIKVLPNNRLLLIGQFTNIFGNDVADIISMDSNGYISKQFSNNASEHLFLSGGIYGIQLVKNKILLVKNNLKLLNLDGSLYKDFPTITSERNIIYNESDDSITYIKTVVNTSEYSINKINLSETSSLYQRFDEITTESPLGIQYLGFGEASITDSAGVDYSSLAFNSLVPKKYVDDAITLSETENNLTFENGLTNTSGTVGLGGSITNVHLKATALATTPSNMYIEATDVMVGDFVYGFSGGENRDGYALEIYDANVWGTGTDHYSFLGRYTNGSPSAGILVGPSYVGNTSTNALDQVVFLIPENDSSKYFKYSSTLTPTVADNNSVYPYLVLNELLKDTFLTYNSRGDISLTSEDPRTANTYSQVFIRGNILQLKMQEGDSRFGGTDINTTIKIDGTSGTTIKEGALLLGFGETDNTGLGADYSTLVGTSLVPKKYVDDAITTLNTDITNAQKTFSNGLTDTSGNVTLGGTLTQDTLIDGSVSDNSLTLLSSIGYMNLDSQAISLGIDNVPTSGIIVNEESTDISHSQFVNVGIDAITSAFVPNLDLSSFDEGIQNTWVGAGEFITGLNDVNYVQSNADSKKGTIIGSSNSLINPAITNSVIIGGSGIHATANDTVYISNLNVVNTVNSKLTYNSSFSFTSLNDLVDKKYVDDEITALNTDINNAQKTFSNGLTDTTGTVKLGGDLIESTVLNSQLGLNLRGSSISLTNLNDPLTELPEPINGESYKALNESSIRGTVKDGNWIGIQGDISNASGSTLFYLEDTIADKGYIFRNQIGLPIDWTGDDFNDINIITALQIKGDYGIVVTRTAAADGWGIHILDLVNKTVKRFNNSTVTSSGNFPVHALIHKIDISKNASGGYRFAFLGRNGVNSNWLITIYNSLDDSYRSFESGAAISGNITTLPAIGSTAPIQFFYYFNSFTFAGTYDSENIAFQTASGIVKYQWSTNEFTLLDIGTTELDFYNQNTIIGAMQYYDGTANYYNVSIVQDNIIHVADYDSLFNLSFSGSTISNEFLISKRLLKVEYSQTSMIFSGFIESKEVSITIEISNFSFLSTDLITQRYTNISLNNYSLSYGFNSELYAYNDNGNIIVGNFLSRNQFDINLTEKGFEYLPDFEIYEPGLDNLTTRRWIEDNYTFTFQNGLVDTNNTIELGGNAILSNFSLATADINVATDTPYISLYKDATFDYAIFGGFNDYIFFDNNGAFAGTKGLLATVANGQGIKYTSNLTDAQSTSLVDKKYVDDAITLSETNNALTFENGLTNTSGTVTLGGNISESTTLTLSADNSSLNFTTTDFTNGGAYYGLFKGTQATDRGYGFIGYYNDDSLENIFLYMDPYNESTLGSGFYVQDDRPTKLGLQLTGFGETNISTPGTVDYSSLVFNSLTPKKYVDDNIALHADLTNNPHSVTQTQVGLGNVDNTSDLDKPISTATQDALDLKLDADAYNPNQGGLIVVDASSTLTVDDYKVFVNSTDITITLPVSTSTIPDGQTYIIKDVIGASETNPINIDGNGINIEGLPQIAITVSMLSYEITYSSQLNQWYITGTANYSNLA